MSTPTPAPSPTADRIAAARAAIAENPVWYHAIELAPGVVTPGFVDHRPVTPRILPRDLTGVRALEVGTFDGHWSFAMEERGAKVTALDLPAFEATNFPPLHRERLLREMTERDMELGRGFKLAHAVRGSSVQRLEVDVQSFAPGEVPGEYDLVFVGAILLHLRDPVGALERLLGCLRPGGRLIAFEAFSLAATLRAPRRAMATFETVETAFNWWVPNLAALRAWFLTAGFVDVRRHAIMRPPTNPEMRGVNVLFTAKAP
jgi:SAM-dependent methyltransferase